MHLDTKIKNIIVFSFSYVMKLLRYIHFGSECKGVRRYVNKLRPSFIFTTAIFGTHFWSLYLQADSKSTAQLLESIIFVIDAVIPLIRKPPQTVVEELEQDLKQMIVRHSFLTVVHACIK
jgi:hypothetical protein